jgi:hypothetical protein
VIGARKFKRADRFSFDSVGDALQAARYPDPEPRKARAMGW